MLEPNVEARVFLALELLFNFRKVVSFHQIRFFIDHFQVGLFRRIPDKKLLFLPSQIFRKSCVTLS